MENQAKHSAPSNSIQERYHCTVILLDISLFKPLLIILVLLLFGFSPKKIFPSELDSLVAVWEDSTLADTARLRAMRVYSSRRWLKCTHDSLYLTGVQMYELAEKSGNMFYKSFGLRNQVYAKLYSREYEECEELLTLKMQIDSARGNSYWVAFNYFLFAEIGMWTFNYPFAISQVDKSFDLWKEMDNKSQMAMVINYKGVIYNRQGDYNNALKYTKQAIDIARTAGNENSTSIFRTNLALLIAKQGNYKEALSILFEAREIFRKNNSNFYFAMNSEAIGDIMSQLGNYSEARNNYEIYIKQYTKVHMPDAAAKVEIKIGNTLIEEGNYTGALKLFRQSLQIFKDHNQEQNIALAYERLGYLNFHLAHYTDALEYFNKSLKIYSEIGYYDNKANVYAYIGQVHNELGEYGKSLEYYLRSLEYNLSIGFKHKTSEVYRDLGVSFMEQGDLTTAIEFYENSRKIREEIGDKRGIAEVYIDLGNLSFLKKNIQEGLNWCQKGYDIAVDIGVLKLEMEAANCLYKANKKLGNGSVALNYYERYLAIKDSLNTDEADKKLQQMEFDRKRTVDSLAMVEQNLKTELSFQQTLTEEKNTRNTIMFAGFGILLLAGGVFSRMLFIRKTNKELEKKNKIIAKEKERAEESEKAKEQFFDNISHEFRTPLTLILGPLNEAMNSTKDKHAKSNLEMMKRNAVRLQGMINELLHLSKLEFGKIKLQASEENIVKITEDYLQSFESLADQRKISLSFKSSSSDIQVYIDVKNYNKILANLLSNAIKFTEEGGKVSVSVSSWQLAFGSSQSAVLSRQSVGNKNMHENRRLMTEDRRLETEDQRLMTVDSLKRGILIKVTDTGIGIPEDKIQHIFDRFYQVGEHQLSHQPGTGIGLALTKELVELNHGEISVESKPGKGTTFSIFLQSGREHFKDEEIVPPTKFENQETEWAVEKKISGHVTEEEVKKKNELPVLLIVEDNPDMRSYIKNSFGNNYTILEASNGEAGLQLAIDKVPDLIISDVMMPKMDGCEMTEKLKTDQRTNHIPIIILTARASDESRIEGLEAGADAYVTKPFNSEELRVRVNKLIEQRQKLRVHFSQTLESQEIFLVKDPQLMSMDRQFLEKAMEVVNKHIANPDFDAKTFASDMAVSRMQLHRKIKALTNKSTTEFFRTVRLNQAAKLIRNKADNITQIAYETGFTSLSWFAKAFKEQFGMTPSEYND